jgi:hypothetical protein
MNITCRACLADAADIGTFDHGIAHDLNDGCVIPRDIVDDCGRTGNHAFHRQVSDAPHGTSIIVSAYRDCAGFAPVVRDRNAEAIAAGRDALRHGR